MKLTFGPDSFLVLGCNCSELTVTEEETLENKVALVLPLCQLRPGSCSYITRVYPFLLCTMVRWPAWGRVPNTAG